MLISIAFSSFLIYFLYALYQNFKPISFKGKVIWITGASSGIGEGLAREFHRLGAFIILSGRNQSELSRVHSSLSNSKIFELDLSDSSKVFQRSKELLSSHQVDVLINNAGVSQRCMFDQVLGSLKVERSLMEVNFFSVAALTKCFAKSLNGRKGTVVVVSSTAGLIPSIGSSGYSAAKCGIVCYYQSIAAELKELGISVVNLAPGFVNTKLSMNALNFKGDKLGVFDPRNKDGIDVETFSKEAARGIYNGKKEIIVSQKIILAMFYLRSFSMEACARFMRYRLLEKTKNILKKSE